MKGTFPLNNPLQQKSAGIFICFHFKNYLSSIITGDDFLDRSKRGEFSVCVTAC